MKFLEKLVIGQKVLQGIAFRKKFPLAVGWNITYRCNLQCKYCGFWQKKAEELSAKDIFRLIKELASCGTKFIGFSGGEPLLKEELPEIIDFCKMKKIYVSINSNGTLVKQGIKGIRNADAIKLSLDGPRHINDAVRGEGVHDKVIEAIEICKREKIKVNIVTVISKYNIFHIPYVLKVAEKYNVGVYFQPADRNHSGDSDEKESGIIDEAHFKKIVNFLIDEKLKGNKFIDNSTAGLRHLYHWPNPKKIFCLKSLFVCDIEPDGRIFICDDFPDSQRYTVPVNSSFKESFDNLSLPHPCKQCWTASLVEFNLMGSFKLGSMVSMWKRFREQ